MENPFRRRAAFELARLLSEIIAHCQHGHPSFLRVRAAEQAWRSCRDTAVLQAWIAHFCQVNPGTAAHRPAMSGRNRPGACPPAGRSRRVRPLRSARSFPFASNRLLGEEDRGRIGGRFDPSTFRHPSTGSGTKLKASQAQGPGSRHRRLNELGDGKIPELFGGFRIGGTRDTSRENFQDRLACKPL